jgi:hypothetical protein
MVPRAARLTDGGHGAILIWSAQRITATDKAPTPAVDRHRAHEHQRPTVVRFQVHSSAGLTPRAGPLPAAHVRRRLVDLVRDGQPKALLVFMSVPQPLAAQLGHEWNGLPLTVLHEFDGSAYRTSLVWSPQTKAPPEDGVEAPAVASEVGSL